MGIQINGQTDTVTSTTAGGRVTVTSASFPSVDNLNATGIITASSFRGNVTGNINATGLSTFSGGLLVGTGASISSPATNVLTLGTNNTESVRIDSSGRVGIGTNIPESNLDVYANDIVEGDAHGQIVIRDLAAYNANPISGIIFKGEHTPGSGAYFSSIYGGKENSTNGNYAGYLALATRTQGSTTAERLRIDSSGRMTLPYQPSFSVWLNGNQDIAHNTQTKVRFNAEVFDVGGNFDSSTNYRFTAPVAGKYLFMGHLYIYPTYQVEVYIYKNGSEYKRFSGPLGSGGNDNPNGLDFLDIINLAVNDYVEIYGLQARTGDSATVSIYGGGVKESSFVGYLIG